MPEQCLYFGCWNEPGHFLWFPNGKYVLAEHRNYYGNRIHLDGTLAPRRAKRTGWLCWAGAGDTPEKRQHITYDSAELPQGQFLLHRLDTGYTAIQWWDRTQGDTRGACNSTILLEGNHTADEMLMALAQHFPHVLANLTKAGVTLVEVKQ